MREGRSRDQWDHTAAIVAQVYNVSVASRSDLRSPDSFNPYYRRERAKAAAGDGFAALKATFVDGPVGKKLQADARRVRKEGKRNGRSA